ELIDADVTGEGSVGALAGWNNGIVENTYATGEVNGDGYAVGGLIGENDGTVTGSHFDGTIATVEGNESGDFAGGLIGVNYDNGSITDCYAIATVTSEVGYGTGGLVGANYGPINDSHAICSVTGNDTVGGLVGENNIGTIDNSYADGDVTGSSRVGGLTGFNEFAITDSYFTGTVTASDDYSGGLVGESIGSIRDCHADAAVISTADYVGGLAGYSRGASFSYATGSVTGESYVGGLIGESYRNFASDVIDASYSTSAVTGHSHIGGLAGSNEADISASYAKGAVTGVEKAGIDSTYAGGLVGRNTGPISISYAWGDVSGHEYVGGLVGYNEGPDATILNCYEIGAVDGNDGSFVGPLIGRLNLLSSEDIIGSFWNNNTSGHDSSDWGIEEGSVTMMQQVTYFNEGWNFDTIWGINTVDNNRYPFLRWQFDAEFAGGDGSAENPFLVADADQLNNVRNHLDKHFLQTHDINLSGYSGGEGWEPIGDNSTPFTGTYDGNDYSVNNLTIDCNDNYSGLFGYIAVNGNISDLDLNSVDVTSSSDYVGGLAGRNNGLIDNCSVSGTVSINGWYYPVGGLIGENHGMITNCSFDGTVEGEDDYCGGLVGWDEGTIIDCHTTGTVRGDDEVGGLVGYKVSGIIRGSHSECTVTALNLNSTQTGGLVGNNDGEIDGCYALGAVTGNDYVGGLVGFNYSPGGAIVNSYATGSVTGNDYVGGLVGGNGKSITDCYSSGAVVTPAASANTGGLAGYTTAIGVVTDSFWNTETSGKNTSVGGTGKTTAEMKQQATFTDWDFTTVWGINSTDNGGYPFLRWQGYVPTAPAGGSNGRRTAQIPVYQASIRAEDGTETAVAVLVNRDGGIASIEEDPWHGMPQGELAVTIPAIPGVDAYALSIPVTDLSTPDAQGMLEISTDQGSVVVPSNMLTGTGQTDGNQARITIGSVDRSDLPEDAAEIIGDRPLLQLRMSIDGRQLDWNNSQAPVRVSIPYAPTTAELEDPEHIVVVYVDGAGNLHSVPNGRYDAETGTVTFTTTHFSHYAVAYVHRTFEDLEAVLWGKKQIEVLASKGIVKGVSQTTFAPEAAITRADFLCLLVRTLGWEGEPEGSFSDVAEDAYYWRETGIAKELGIVSGIGNDRFDPDVAISRQDMMVMTERALGVLNGSAVEGAASDLDRFSDRAQIAGYAVNSIAALVKEGLIEGGNGEMNPRGEATRAETAVFLYRIYNSDQ
ncbi:MAG: GLUG motif-containing protein, partial [Anaerovoracaceae bacterium]